MNNHKELVFGILATAFIALIYFGEKVDRNQLTTATITGVVENNIGDTIKFHGPDSTYITTLDTVTGIFYIEFDWDSAAFVDFFHGKESTEMYIKPNDKIQLTIDTEQFDETIKYTGSVESSYLAWKYLYNESLDWPNLMVLSEEELDSTYASTIQPFIRRARRFQETNPEFFASIQDGYNSQLEYVKNRKAALAALPQPGEDPSDFTFPDRDGKDVSLSDFVGKMVYVDVWATWCGPCVAEVPHLILLEEEYHDANITFLGVSVDTDSTAWVNFIEDEGMQGVHINTGAWKTHFMDDYAINGIPRFMIFDENGKVLDLNAPRPSSDEIRPLLDGILNDGE
jgi:thiol-disulfide isomerase/thioredoxin